MNTITSQTKLINGALESRQGGRPENQDFVGFADTPFGFLLVLCDGMGGGPGGRTASTSVVAEVVRYISSQPLTTDRRQLLINAVADADEMIVRMTTERPVFMGMGTTICILLVSPESAMVAHVGDSRIYQFRMKHKVFRSADHSQVAELVRSGHMTEEQARLAPNSNVITRAINGKGIAQPDVIELPYEKGDRFMLCTDGIWGTMPEPLLIKKAVTAGSASGAVVQLACDADNIGKAEGGHHDNLTVAVIDTLKNSKKKVKMGKNILRTVIALAVMLFISIIANVILVKNSGPSEAERQQMEQLQTENAKLQGGIESLEKSIADYKELLVKRQQEKAGDDETMKIQRDQIEELLQQVKELNEKVGASKAESKEDADIAYAKARLSSWKNSKDPINSADIDTVLRRLHAKNYHKADAKLNEAKKAFAAKGDKNRVQKQHEAFNAALNILNKK